MIPLYDAPPYSQISSITLDKYCCQKANLKYRRFHQHEEPTLLHLQRMDIKEFQYAGEATEVLQAQCIAKPA